MPAIFFFFIWTQIFWWSSVFFSLPYYYSSWSTHTSNIPESELFLQISCFSLFSTVCIIQPWNIRTMFDSFPFLPATLTSLLGLFSSCHLFSSLNFLFCHCSSNNYYFIFGLLHSLRNFHLSNLFYTGWGDVWPSGWYS